MVTEKYILENLSCADCAEQIEQQVKKLAEVESARLDFISKRLVIETRKGKVLEHNIKRIIKSIEPDVQVRQISDVALRQPANIPYPLLSAGLGVIILMSAYVLNATPETRLYLFLIAYLLSSWKVLYNAVVKALSGRLLDEHFLMTIASIGAFYLKEYPEAIAVMVLYEIGQYFENKAVNHSRNSIQSMLKLKPDLVHKVVDNTITDMRVSELSAGDCIIILPGERVPLDGLIIQGQSSLDTSALTGEAMPRPVGKGESVLSGTLNLSGKLTLKVTSIDAESTVSRILKLVEEANQRKSRTERFITRFAKKYTPAVVLLAIFIAIAMPILTQSGAQIWFKRALIFLIVSCPCALIISVPLTNFAAIGAAARKGILFKGSNFIDALARATTFVYDKTGTLTTGKLSILAVKPAEQFTEQQLIISALTCEESSNHPIALAVRNKYIKIQQAEQVLMQQEFHGKGIMVQTLDTIYYAGSMDFLQSRDVSGLPVEPEETCIYLAEKNKYLGIITFKDEIRPGFAEVIRKLKHMGVRRHIMLTGDHASQADKVASELKLNKYFAKLLPEEKLKELEVIEQSQNSPVAFIGDGLNDAPVLSRAEIGIAMGAIGNQASIEAADVVLMQDDPQQLLSAVKLSRKTRNVLWQNIFFAFGIKALVMILGTFGLANIWEAVIADVGVTLLAVANSMRLLRI
jgi:Zn2+/Cd2+-exporting ATPase